MFLSPTSAITPGAEAEAEAETIHVLLCGSWGKSSAGKPHPKKWQT